MKLILFDLNKSICDAWSHQFADYNNVKVINDDFRNLKNYVSVNEKIILSTAGNSFGIMGGGIDWAIANYFSGLEQDVRDIIQHYFLGEMPVGTSELIKVSNKYDPFFGVLYTPTMRVPMDIRNTFNVYLATIAAITEYTLSEQTNDCTLALPGFGGKCGRVSPNIIAKQMEFAYIRIMNRIKITNHDQMFMYHKALQQILK